MGTEPEISINGHRLNHGQAMTARVAITVFMEDWDDAMLKAVGEIGHLYRARKSELVSLLLTPSPDTVRKLEDVG